MPGHSNESSLDKKIYLASKSPRRRELLRQVGVEFELLMLRSDPRAAPTSPKTSVPAKRRSTTWRAWRAKRRVRLERAAPRRMPLRPVLSADTTVTIDGEILGKPANPMAKPPPCWSACPAAPTRC
jgi:septum formation protein